MKGMICVRAYSILKELQNAQDYINVDFLMNTFHVSKRTIQSDLSYLIQQSSRNGYHLYSKRTQGYLLEITNADLYGEFMDLLSSEKALDSKERIKNMIAYIAVQNGFITMDKLAEINLISKSSIKNEMKDIEVSLKKYNLTVDKKVHYGVRINGEAIDFKKMFVDLYFDNNQFVCKSVDDCLKDFKEVNTLLFEFFEKENLNINYNELKNVIVWLQITTWYCISNDNTKNGLSKYDKNDAIERISYQVLKEIEKIYNTHIDQESFTQIKNVFQKNVRKKLPEISFNDSLNIEVEKFLEDVDLFYKTNFKKDEDFKSSLINHVSLLIERLHQKISYKNTIISEICIRYPMLFNIAIRFSDMLKEKYDVDVTQDEAGFIATHFAAHMEREQKYKMQKFNKIAVVCSSGGGSAYLIKLQIETLFGSGNVQTFNHLQMKEVANYNPDLIFTIMPLSREFKIPIIYIKELLDEQDLLRIRQVLQYDHYGSLSLSNMNDNVYSVFQKTFFKIGQENDYIELISKMADEIEEKGYGGRKYKEYVLEREIYMDTIYMNGVCIPHPININCNENLIYVYLLEKPIKYHEKEVGIVFMISLTKECYELHKDITRKLYQLMKDEKRLNRILKSKTLEELIIVMKELDGGSL